MIPVFFSEKMNAVIASQSPSAGKPAQVVAAWKQLGIPLEFHEQEPVTLDELYAAHDKTFVDDVLACRRANGFNNHSPDVANSLPYTSGAMLSAARHVLQNHIPFAAAPCSGFQHAEHNAAMGFCTFNGLMITACA